MDSSGSNVFVDEYFDSKSVFARNVDRHFPIDQPSQKKWQFPRDYSFNVSRKCHFLICEFQNDDLVFEAGIQIRNHPNGSRTRIQCYHHTPTPFRALLIVKLRMV